VEHRVKYAKISFHIVKADNVTIDKPANKFVVNLAKRIEIQASKFTNGSSKKMFIIGITMHPTPKSTTDWIKIVK
jgi:hypothetical protein